MLGAIIGDIIGSVYENLHTKKKDFRLFTPVSTFTDDTVLTVAVADAILNAKPYGPTLKAYARRYPLRGYGPSFLLWMTSPGLGPYNSFGNGSAMRVSPVGHAFESDDDVLLHARKSAECTHSHPEGIKGAQAVALAVFMARRGSGKEIIRQALSEQFSYNLSRTVDDIRSAYRFDVTSQGSVPEAIISFLDSNSFEDAIRNAVSLGGDADTQASIAGAIAEVYYCAIPAEIVETVWKKLPEQFRSIISEFYTRFGTSGLTNQVPKT